MNRGRTVAYCYDCKKDLCNPTIRECAEEIASAHTQLKYLARDEVHATCTMVVVK